MKFIDEAVITVAAGNGGRGCVSFRREKYVPRGGPDGGDGGDGGDVIIRTTARRRTLYQFQYKKHFKAADGGAGQGKQKTGRSGRDVVLELPPGTVVRDGQTGDLVCDCIEDGQTLVIARGGRGGRGNMRFATSTNRAPRHAQPGLAGESKTLQLDLKLIADVGIIGMPNAGKSTLISRLSAARPKIADYPFTTIYPILGVVAAGDAEPFVLADIPGLIEGAHQGAGLGTRFLRHVERTRLLLHLMDAATIDPQDPLAAYHIINNELAGFSETLAQKPRIIAVNKMDLSDSATLLNRVAEALPEIPVFGISAATGQGLDSLQNALIAAVFSDRATG
ncbi:MAG: GTPase ObgE [Thermodesulfobacteriota bacterium]